METALSRTEMQRAWNARDASYDGIFFFGVRTTGVFCRPSCTARKPLVENVEYFASPRAATFAGYRPCKRCRPLEAHGAPPAWVKRLLAQVEAQPQQRVREQRLRQMGIDPARARRYFQKHYGMSFNAYCRGRRMNQALQDIRNGTALDDVALGHGFGSHSGFREAFRKTFGAPPAKGASAGCIQVTWMESPLGPLVAAAAEDGVCLLEFSDRRMLEAQFTRLRQRFGQAIVPGENAHLAQLKAQLAEYFAGTRRDFELPLSYPGTPFQEKVWSALLQIPYGVTCSYEDIARKVGTPAAVRAVGTTNGLNRICIVIPCHRVVNKSGKLGGYGGGLWRKQFLLDLEQGRRRLVD